MNQLMPHIPSSAELGYMGSMKKYGRNGDTELAHVAPGEVIVPPEVIEQYPQLGAVIGQALSSMGADPNRYVVGSSASSLNPNTGQPEFFLKSISKALKKIASSPIGKIALPAALSIALPGAGIASSAVGGALGSAAATKLSGGSWGQALGAGIGSYAGSNIGLGGVSGTVGGSLSKAGLSSIGGILPSAVSNAALSTIGGAWLGSSIGESLGGIIDPPKSVLGTNLSTSPQLSSVTSNIPQYSSANDVALPSAATEDAPSKGAGINAAIPASTVSYLTTVRNRDTGQEQTISAPFNNNFDSTRRTGWGSGVTFV